MVRAELGSDIGGQAVENAIATDVATGETGKDVGQAVGSKEILNAEDLLHSGGGNGWGNGAIVVRENCGVKAAIAIE